MNLTTTQKGSSRKSPAKRKAPVRAENIASTAITGASAKREGIFITLEGGEGAGKSTQIRLLTDRLQAMGHSVTATREPGGSPGAEAVRHVLLSGAAESLGPELEAILFSASRADHVDAVIRPAIDAGKVVISDRFYDSTRVYQGVEGKLDPAFVRQLEQVAVGDTIPDLTIILDLDPQEGMKRAAIRRGEGEAPDRYEKESVRLQKLRRKAFLDIARKEPARCAVVDASGSADEVFERLWRVVEDRLGSRLTGTGKRQKVAKPARKKVAAAGTGNTDTTARRSRPPESRTRKTAPRRKGKADE